MLLVTLVNQDYNEHFAMLLPSPLLSRESLFRFSLVQYVKDLFFRLVCPNRVENKGLEPLTPCVQGRCSKPTELIPRIFN